MFAIGRIEKENEVKELCDIMLSINLSCPLQCEKQVLARFDCCYLLVLCFAPIGFRVLSKYKMTFRLGRKCGIWFHADKINVVYGKRLLVGLRKFGV